MSGNLCRCGAYEGIAQAVERQRRRRVSPRLVKTEAVVEGRDGGALDARRGRRHPGVRGRRPRPPRSATPTPRLTATARLDRQRPLHVGHHSCPGMLEAAVLRSPHANARLTAIDARRGTGRARRALRRSPRRRLPDTDGSAAADATPRLRRRRGRRGRRRRRADARPTRRWRRSRPQCEELGVRRRHRRGARDARTSSTTRPEYERGDADAALAARRASRRRGRVPGAGPAAQLHGAALRRRRLARRRADRVELDPGHLRGAGPSWPRRSASTPSGCA